MLRIEAVFEGIGVAWLRASGAFGHCAFQNGAV